MTRKELIEAAKASSGHVVTDARTDTVAIRGGSLPTGRSLFISTAKRGGGIWGMGQDHVTIKRAAEVLGLGGAA